MNKKVSFLIASAILVSALLSMSSCSRSGSYKQCAAKCEDKFGDYSSETENLKHCKRKCVKRYS